MKLCVNCKWHEKRPNLMQKLVNICTRKEKSVRNPVTGELRSQGAMHCSIEREPGWFACGPRGRYYEAR